jgi:lipopolysaccharide transport system permease protein
MARAARRTDASTEAAPPVRRPSSLDPGTTLVLEAGRTDSHYWRDVWEYRELLLFLAWRDVLVRYKQTVIGAAWAVLRPLLTMVVFTAVFGRLAGLSSGGAPYPLFVLAAVLPWQLFASAVSESSVALVTNTSFLSKVYFPRLIVPASAVVVSAVDFAVSFAILVGMMAWYGVVPDWRIVTLPFFVLLALACSIGIGVWLAALTVKYRDFRYVVPFLVQLGLYVSPVGFSSDIVPARWRLVYALNPMVSVIDGVRWGVLGGSVQLYAPGLLVSAAVTLLVCVVGVRYFRRTERQFADVV